MNCKFFCRALIVVAFGTLISVPLVSAQPSPAGNVRDAVMYAKQAVDHGKQGHADALVTHAEKSRNHAERGARTHTWTKQSII
ncbi:MAG: hypothetical protein MRJ68_14445 [Nitrospira sp.]|nr:hypothetical protein [Nitrospira sp.]